MPVFLVASSKKAALLGSFSYACLEPVLAKYSRFFVFTFHLNGTRSIAKKKKRFRTAQSWCTMRFE
jgi:hypothetical protein